MKTYFNGWTEESLNRYIAARVFEDRHYSREDDNGGYLMTWSGGGTYEIRYHGGRYYDDASTIWINGKKARTIVFN